MAVVSDNKYFLSSFFWSTLSKVLNAVFGFVSVPLLLGYFGKADYGLLSIATACNGYMHLMDLGMNTGAIKFFSQWEAEGKRDMVYRVSRTNITFYFIVSLVNVIALVALAIWGENLFSISRDQFEQLRLCFFILALFSSINWVTTAYNQLLTAYRKIDFTMMIQSLLVILKGGLIASVLVFGLSLSQYFFYLTLLISGAIIPYAIKCKKDGLIDSFKPATYWSDFKIVLSFSLSIFALSLFQVTATQSRPILLSIFSNDGAASVADFRVLEVIPQFIITVCGTFTGIFLPKSSEMLIQNSKDEIQQYVNNWTIKTTIIVCLLCFPFIVGAPNIISAYVGEDFAYLGKWLQLWCFFLIIQMHSTPAFSFILANGRTKVLVYSTAIACILSMIVNAFLCNVVPVGSAVVGYIVYMLSLIGVYYGYLYRKYLGLDSLQILKSFFKPLILGLISCVIPYFVNIDSILPLDVINKRLIFLIEFLTKAILWLIPYLLLLRVTKIFNVKFRLR